MLADWLANGAGSVDSYPPFVTMRAVLWPDFSITDFSTVAAGVRPGRLEASGIQIQAEG